MKVQRSRVTVLTDGAGAATAFTEVLQGELRQIVYTKVDFSNGSTFTITQEDTGETLWGETGVNASTFRAPRAQVSSTAGVASLFAAGGTAVQDRIALPTGRIKIVISGGGAAKTGVFDFIVS